MLQVRLLGQFEVRRDGTPVVIYSRAAQSLLAFLLLNAGIAHRREKLAGLLWSDLPEENARNNLRRELWRLRKVIQAEGYLLSDDISVTFDTHSAYWLDTAVLEQERGLTDDLMARLRSIAVNCCRAFTMSGLSWNASVCAPFSNSR